MSPDSLVREREKGRLQRGIEEVDNDAAGPPSLKSRRIFRRHISLRYDTRAVFEIFNSIRNDSEFFFFHVIAEKILDILTCKACI